jgi:hypothetical protein
MGRSDVFAYDLVAQLDSYGGHVELPPERMDRRFTGLLRRRSSVNDPTAERLYRAALTLLENLATGKCAWGDSPVVPMKDLLASAEIQELSDATDAYGRSTA